jgi:2,3-bisphosphoglycerate-independent phosphoglycerate mutase
MSILGYDPRTYYRGRSAIEAGAMGIGIEEGEIVFRCNLVSIEQGKMADYSAGHISTREARALIETLDKRMGDGGTRFFPGVSYRHILKLKGHPETLKADCTPPHDIPGKAVADYLPKGDGSQVLRDLMERAEAILRNHPLNLAKKARGETQASNIWLFWPSGLLTPLPPFDESQGVKAGMISGVDLLRGLASMSKMEVINIRGVTDGPDNDYAAQAEGAFEALERLDLVVVHVEAPDEAGHEGMVEEKVKAIEELDSKVVGPMLEGMRKFGDFRLMVLPDHPTPLSIKTHARDPVPYVIYDSSHNVEKNRAYDEKSMAGGLLIEQGYRLMDLFIKDTL